MIHHKFRAKPSSVDGIHFASQKERNYYENLKLRQAGGDIVFFLMQVPFRLSGGIRYLCDFAIFEKDGTVRFVDVKGMRTREYITKKKLVEATYPVQIEEY